MSKRRKCKYHGAMPKVEIWNLKNTLYPVREAFEEGLVTLMPHSPLLACGGHIPFAAMQTLQASYLFCFPKTLNPPSHHFHSQRRFLLVRNQPLSFNFVAKSFSSDEFPVDETFLENFGPKDKETEDEARRRNWIERGWAPWEEVLTPEADFARKSLNEGEEVPLQSPEAIEAFKMLSPKYRKKKMEDMGLTEDDYYRKQFDIKGEIPPPLETYWAGPMVMRLVPPRDWPPRGWEVDRKELAFIREAHKLQGERITLEELEAGVSTETDDLCLDRYKMFVKQYTEWVEANRDQLEEESYKVSDEYPHLCPFYFQFRLLIRLCIVNLTV